MHAALQRPSHAGPGDTARTHTHRGEAHDWQVLISNAVEEPLRRFLAVVTGVPDAARAAAPRTLASRRRVPGGGARLGVAAAAAAARHRVPCAAAKSSAAAGTDENCGSQGNGVVPAAKRACPGAVGAVAAARVLTGSQMHVLEAAREGRSFFFTGSAGTGKSLVLNEIVKTLPPALTAVTASTGAAACAIGVCGAPYPYRVHLCVHIHVLML